MPIIAEREIGEGQGVVYVWFYSTHRELARLTGARVWRCKVGFTRRDTIIRVLEGSKTARPEPPVLGLVIHTDEPGMLESGLHRLLKATDGKWIQEEGCGDEWFHTSPEEVEDLYTQIKEQGCPKYTYTITLDDDLGREVDRVRTQLTVAIGKEYPMNTLLWYLIRRGIEAHRDGFKEAFALEAASKL